MKKKKIISVLSLLLFLFGACLVMYPSVSNWINQRNSTKAFIKYDKAVSKIDNNYYEEMLNEAAEHNKKIQEAGSLGASVYMEGQDDLETYNKILDPSKNGVMAWIRIPKIHVSLPIYHTTEEAVLQKAVGHYVGSSFPIGGEGTHCVVTSHRGLPSARLFTELDLLEKGDVFYIDVLDQKLAYKVDKISTVLPDIEKELDVIPGEDHVTLVTCTPYAVNTHRLLVRGTRIPYNEKEEQKEIEKAEQNFKTETIQRIIFVICFAIVVFGMTVIIARKLRDKSSS